VLAYGDSEVLDPLTDQVLPSLKPSYSPIYQALHGYIGSTFSIDNRQSQFTAGLHAFAAHQTAASTLVDAAAASHALGTPGGPERIPFLTQRDHALQTSGREQPDEATGPRSAVTVSIIIPTRDRRELLEPCITSLLADTNYPRELLEIIVVDNGSTEPGTLEYLRRLRRDGLVVIRDDGDFNYPRLNNRAAGIATGEVLVLLNNDTTVFDADWLHIMVSYAMRPGVGAVGAKLLYPDLSVQHGGVVLGIQGVAAHVNHMLPFDDESYETIADRTHEVAAVTGACLAIRRAVYGEIGQLDESLAVTFNDIDLCCAALTHGYRNVYVGSALIIHHESKSRGYDIKPEQQEAFRIEAIRARSKHPDLYGDDPYYNPNFSLERTYDFAEPPRAIRPWILARRNAEESRCILMLSSTHQIGHGVAVVVDIQARHLASLGHRVIVGGPVSQSDFAYKDCERVDLRNEIEAAQFAFECGADVVVMHTPPFFGTARWLGAEQIKIAYDYGEPDPDLFSDAQSRRNVLADKRFSMALADRRYAISESVRAESSFTDMGVIPLGNAHLATWGPEHESVRAAIRARHGWTNKLVVFNVCRFHGAERNYKGVDAYSTLLHVLKSFTPGLANDVVFVLCGKGDTRDVREMEAKGLTVFANVTDAEMTELYAAADLYINLSLWEGYNLGIGQALAMGLPTLASDIPAHRAFEIKTTNDVVEQVAWLQMQSDGLVAGSSPRRVPRVWGWEPSLRQLAAIIAAS
jgi:GT2 family glycosyltransferase